MTNFKRNVTRGDVRDNLLDWIRKGVGFKTPVRDTGMMTTRGYYGGFRSSTISGHFYDDSNGNRSYVVMSYETPIMRVDFEKSSKGELVPKTADFDNRKYSVTTNIMQGFCEWVLKELFGLPWIPPVIGKRGGRHIRREHMVVFGNSVQGFSWGSLDTATGEIIPLREDGDTYKSDDTEGYY